MYTCSLFTLLDSRNQYNIVKQLSANFLKIKMIVNVLNTAKHQSHGSCAEKGQEKEKADPLQERASYGREWGTIKG